jgi:hypothetical protein
MRACEATLAASATCVSDILAAKQGEEEASLIEVLLDSSNIIKHKQR